MGFEINWSCTPNDPVKLHPLYQKWSPLTLQEVVAAQSQLQGDLIGIRMDCDSTTIVSYLCWLQRVVTLVA